MQYMFDYNIILCTVETQLSNSCGELSLDNQLVRINEGMSAIS